MIMEFTFTWLSLALSGLITIAIFSFLYKENPAYRLAEHILIGSFIGHTIVMALKVIKEAGFDRFLSGGELVYAIPTILGLLFFSRYIRGYEWLMRYPLAFMIGVTAAVQARARFQASILTQIKVTISNPLNNLNNIIIFLALLCGISYFIFTKKHTGALGISAKIGRMVLLLSFGITVAMDWVSRSGYIVSRFDWLVLNVPEVIVVTVIIFSVYIFFDIFKNKNTLTPSKQ